MEALKVYPESVLLQKSDNIDDKKEYQKIADELFKLCRDITWGSPAGMAAPQIGISKRVFVVVYGGIKGAYINPELAWTSADQRTYYEGCYSLEKDRYDYKITRPFSIVLKWFDYDGNFKVQSFQGHEAQIIQHEYDHLEGKLCNRGELNV